MSIVEFLAVQALGLKPLYPLLWLRYSAFIVLYPLGVGSELTMAYLAMPSIKQSRPLSVEMPNSANFGFDYYYFCCVAVVAYLPGMYSSQAPKPRAIFWVQVL